MQHFTLLLLAAASSLMAPAASTESVTTCERSFNVHHLSCDTGVINVEAALYGRADSMTCSEGKPPRQLANTACSHPRTQDFVSKRCNGKKECEINIRDVHSPDPCTSIFKYLQTNYTCLPANRLIACEFSVAHLFCDEGQVIFVYGADYGRRDQTTCAYRRSRSQISKTLCSGPTDKVATRCNGKNKCTFTVNNAFFGDPCQGTYKYLEVAYICEYPGVVTY